MTTPGATDTTAAYYQGTAKLAKLHYPVGEYFFGDRGPRVSGGQGLTFTPAPAQAGPIPPSRTTTITYTYDDLYRLTAADYDDGKFFHYTYDATGNRLTQETDLLTNNYVYDSANRLTSVDGQAYNYDNNGNLLSDGTSTNTYNHANRLTSVTQGGISYNFVYNGLGDRLQQTVDTVTTNYTLDINTRLTQVLSDGTDTYLYGLERIGEYDSANWTYPLADALGSVRQLVDASGAPVMAQNYAPYGDVLSTYGDATSNYGFAGEWTDGTGLQHLRARYLNTGIGRFISRDTWGGDYQRPLSLNRWGYVEGNPVNQVDPSGQFPVPDGYIIGEAANLTGGLPVSIDGPTNLNLVYIWAGGCEFTGDPQYNVVGLAKETVIDFVHREVADFNVGYYGLDIGQLLGFEFSWYQGYAFGFSNPNIRKVGNYSGVSIIEPTKSWGGGLGVIIVELGIGASKTKAVNRPGVDTITAGINIEIGVGMPGVFEEGPQGSYAAIIYAVEIPGTRRKFRFWDEMEAEIKKISRLGILENIALVSAKHWWNDNE